MLKRWSIENFKSFAGRTDILLAPITVFAGANSSGKSTIIQSILLLKQTVQYSPATRPMALNGPLVKLGTFNDVKNAASDKKHIGIGWAIDFEHSENIFNSSNWPGRDFYPVKFWTQFPSLGDGKLSVGDTGWCAGGGGGGI